jgi:hypothetical protein
MNRRIIPALALLLLVPEVLPAQDEFPAGSPESAVLTYIDAMKEGKLDRMAELMHPEALATFHAMMQPIVEAAEKSEPTANEVLQMFDGVTSVAQLRKLGDAKFFSSFYLGMASLEPDLLDALKDADIEVLGHVMEGDDTAHVLYRVTTTTGSTMKQTEVVSLRRTKSGWGVLLTNEIEAMAESIRASIDAHD